MAFTGNPQSLTEDMACPADTSLGAGQGHNDGLGGMASASNSVGGSLPSGGTSGANASVSSAFGSLPTSFMPRNTSVEDFLSLVESGDIPPPEVSYPSARSVCSPVADYRDDVAGEVWSRCKFGTAWGVTQGRVGYYARMMGNASRSSIEVAE